MEPTPSCIAVWVPVQAFSLLLLGMYMRNVAVIQDTSSALAAGLVVSLALAVAVGRLEAAGLERFTEFLRHRGPPADKK